jgi:chemotaxis signal transduction protein
MSEPELAERVDVLLFEVGERLYGADATQVLRIDPRGPVDVAGSLGPLKPLGRALIVRGPEGEASVPVDAVRGIRRAVLGELRRNPAPAHGHPCAIGFWLDGGTPVVLIDLERALSS